MNESSFGVAAVRANPPEPIKAGLTKAENGNESSFGVAAVRANPPEPIKAGLTKAENGPAGGLPQDDIVQAAAYVKQIVADEVVPTPLVPPAEVAKFLAAGAGLPSTAAYLDAYRKELEESLTLQYLFPVGPIACVRHGDKPVAVVAVGEEGIDRLLKELQNEPAAAAHVCIEYPQHPSRLKISCLG